MTNFNQLLQFPLKRNGEGIGFECVRPPDINVAGLLLLCCSRCNKSEKLRAFGSNAPVGHQDCVNPQATNLALKPYFNALVTLCMIFDHSPVTGPHFSDENL